MKITKNRLKQIIKEELESVSNKARAPRSAMAFARQVFEELNATERLTQGITKTGNYSPPQSMSGGYLNKSTWNEGDEEIGLPIYDLGVFRQHTDQAKQILQDSYGPTQQMQMGRIQVSAIPVGKFAIVFDIRNIHVGISKIHRR